MMQHIDGKYASQNPANALSSLHNVGSSNTAKQIYNGKCQYKTGKCYNERTVKRNGEPHSLCEEHRLKQNMIQRRSDRKYQTVHAMRRRERSQKRAVLKRQVSMAVAQQLFYEHQKNSFVSQLGELNDASQPPPSKSHLLSLHHTHNASVSSYGICTESVKLDLESFDLSILSQLEVSISPSQSSNSATPFATMLSSLENCNEKLSVQKDETPTGVEDFTPESFLSVCLPEDFDTFSNIAPLLSAMGEKQMWTDEDVDFLQALIL